MSLDHLSSPSPDAEQPLSAEGQLVALFLAHQARIYAFIVSLVPNRADAEDLLQETGLVLHRRFHEYEPGTSFTAWACQIAKHKVLDLRKRRARNPIQFDTEFVAQIAEHQLQHQDPPARHAALVQCLEKLSHRDRELVERCYKRGSTMKDVAQELKRPADTVYKSLRRIRLQLLACVTRTLIAEERS